MVDLDISNLWSNAITKKQIIASAPPGIERQMNYITYPPKEKKPDMHDVSPSRIQKDHCGTGRGSPGSLTFANRRHVRSAIPGRHPPHLKLHRLQK